MAFISRYKSAFFVFASIVLLLFVFVRCVNEDAKQTETVAENNTATSTVFKTIPYTDFAGSQVCGDCHKNICSHFDQTAHAITSQPATASSIKGSFTKGKNSFMYDANRVVQLEKRADSFYQVYYFKGNEHVRRRFDISVGSGIKGQTYLSWVKGQLIELPVSYFTQVHQWANSPGYPLYPTLFNRPATTRCMECHSTFGITTTAPMQEPEKWDSTKMILGITCERCHGPAAQHVAYQKQHPSDTLARFIINTAKLSRQQNIDLCSLCHSGRLPKTKPSFSFVAGDTLVNYFMIDNSAQSQAANIDVHGNQYGLLAASQCFAKSQTMTCLTCHDAHNNERGNMVSFSQKCATCHTTPHKPVAGITQKQMTANCIDCHMPVQTSQAINFLLQGETMPTHALMRTHYITVYADETKKFIENLHRAHNKN